MGTPLLVPKQRILFPITCEVGRETKDRLWTMAVLGGISDKKDLKTVVARNRRQKLTKVPVNEMKNKTTFKQRPITEVGLTVKRTNDKILSTTSNKPKRL